MRPVPERLTILDIAKSLGAVPYKKNNSSDIKGISFTFEQMDAFVAKILNPNMITRDTSELSAKGWSEAIEAAMAADNTKKLTFSMESIRPKGDRIGKRGRK